MDADCGHFLLLLEDLTAGRPGDSLTGCSKAEGELLLGQLATFHAQWWANPLLSEWKWLEVPDDGFARWYGEWIRSAWPLFRQKYAVLVTGWVADTAERAIQRIPNIFRKLAGSPATLVHGDLWLDNVCFDLPDASLALFDWQLIGKAPGANDIAWFLVRSLPVSVRRANEDHLVRTYHDALVSEGIRDCSLSNLRLDMKLGFLTAFLDVIGSGINADSSSERRRQLMRAWIERSIAMLEDHDVWEALA